MHYHVIAASVKNSFLAHPDYPSLPLTGRGIAARVARVVFTETLAKMRVDGWQIVGVTVQEQTLFPIVHLNRRKFEAVELCNLTIEQSKKQPRWSECPRCSQRYVNHGPEKGLKE